MDGRPEKSTRRGPEIRRRGVRALGNPAGCLDLAVLNSPLWRAAEVPAVNPHATALLDGFDRVDALVEALHDCL